MRYIYLDEAGTSDLEPVSVVAGVIVDADKQYVAAEKKIVEVLDSLPRHLRDDPLFVPHAKSIFHGEGRLRENWDRISRFEFVKNLVGVAPDLNVPICVGLCRRTAPGSPAPNINKLKPAAHHHLLAFALCVGHANRYIVENAAANEVAALVVEDVPMMARMLEGAFDLMRGAPVVATMQHGTPAGLKPPSAVKFEVTRIRDAPNFAKKHQSPFLWVADACAFAYARYLSGGSLGAELVKRIWIPELDKLYQDKTREMASLVYGG